MTGNSNSPGSKRLIAQVALDLPDDWDPSVCHDYADGFHEVIFVYMMTAGTILYHIEGPDGEHIPDPRVRPQEAEEWN